jgi:hypothetical protein
MTLFVRRVGGDLHVEVGQDPQQGRADIDTIPLGKTKQSFEPGKCPEIRHGRRRLKPLIRHLVGTIMSGVLADR